MSEINRLDLLLNLSCLKGAFDLIPRFDFRALDVKLSAPRATDDLSKFSAALKDLLSWFVFAKTSGVLICLKIIQSGSFDRPTKYWVGIFGLGFTVLLSLTSSFGDHFETRLVPAESDYSLSDELSSIDTSESFD